jgi:hypothetical protein
MTVLLLLASACDTVTCGPGTVEVDGVCTADDTTGTPPTDSGDTPTDTADPTDSGTTNGCEPVSVWSMTAANDPLLVNQSHVEVLLDSVDQVSLLCEQTGAPPTWETWIPWGTTWGYLDTGVAPEGDWTAPDFDDSTWAEGPGPLGYGDDVATEVAFGEDPEAKRITTWFRTTVTLDDAAEVLAAELSLRRDDGVVVYLNGQEILRDNLPPGELTPDTLALISVNGNSESIPVTLDLDPALLLTGDNVLAVELHQIDAGSSDLGFDLALTVSLPQDFTGPGEQHVLRSTDAAPLHRFLVQGLLADATYSCTATPDCEGTAADPVELVTGPLPDLVPRFDLVVPASAAAYGAYALVNHGRPCAGDDQNRLLIVDHEGQVRWYFELEGLDQGSTIDLEAQYLGDGLIAWGGGDRDEGDPQIIDVSGEILYTAAYADAGPHVYHHDIEVTDDGLLMGLINTDDEQGPNSWEGFALVEHDPETLEVTWYWETMTAVANGQLVGGGRDPWHANSFAMVDDGDAGSVWVSFLTTDEIVRIDRATGDISWSLGPDGDFTLLDADGTELEERAWFAGLHAIDVDPNGHLMVYDNGTDLDRSRAIELELDTDAMTATLVWSYEEDGWYEPIWGDADTLDNGNKLINMAQTYCWGGNKDHIGALLELDPADDTPVWRVAFADVDDSSYRSEKLDGCEVFANATLCPELLE